MRIFHCDHCDNLVFFENTHCIQCGHVLAFLPDLMEIGSLDPAGERHLALAAPRGAGADVSAV